MVSGDKSLMKFSNYRPCAGAAGSPNLKMIRFGINEMEVKLMNVRKRWKSRRDNYLEAI